MEQYFSTPVAIALTLFAAAMWGSWMQVVKHRKDYPISGLVFWMYGISFVFVWIVTFILQPTLLPQGISAASAGNLWTIVQIALGGAMMSMGLYVSLTVIGNVGLLLSTTVSGAVGGILGLATTISQEGVPGTDAMVLILGTTLTFIVASLLCNVAAKMRDKDRRALEKSGVALDSRRKNEGVVTAKIVVMMLFNSILANGWTMGTAVGTASGFPPILTCAYIATGSFASVLVVCGITFTVKKQWRTVLCIGQSKKPLFLGGISALCHYGGNLISIYSMPVISATMSFLFGRTSSMWTYFWGLAYGEFKHSTRNTMIVLGVGIVLYFVGVALLGTYNLG